ncbi:recombinase family protein [Rhizobium leguminosarum]|uniref:recombinase family protein n=1 Tax=Rhizobium leguminosarum TaxID=384 RepID=UPI0009E2E599
MSEKGILTIGYARVSTKKQTKEGDGLGSQEARIREYARNRGYPAPTVVFTDDRTGATAVRPGFAAMVKFLVKNRSSACVVIIDDINRLARDVHVHHKVRAAIAATGARLECPSFEFGDSSDDILVENLLASVSQHQRQKNGEQVYNRMRGRLLNGYWCFASPPAFQYERVAGQKILVPREPIASIVTEALEGFANGRFETQAEVQRFLQDSPGFPKMRNGTVKIDRVTEMLTSVLHAGMVEYLPWKVGILKGHHVGLITYETYLRIQRRLNENPKAPARADLNENFPLRQAVQCDYCGRLIGGAYSRGRNAEYPYYFCLNRECSRYRKSFSCDETHGRFYALLKTMSPAEEVVDIASDIFREKWEKQSVGSRERIALLQQEMSSTGKSIELLIDRIANSPNRELIEAYEARLVDLQRKKAELSEKILNTGQKLPDFDSTLRTALDFLASPWKLWETGNLEDRRILRKLVFTEHLRYAPESGFRTAETTLPFKVLADIAARNVEMVGPEGLEPPTKRL